MTAAKEARNSNHTLRPRVTLGFTLMFILVLAALVTMLLVAMISVG
jgi:hypothetical protein